jgi:hypothetical protein
MSTGKHKSPRAADPEGMSDPLLNLATPGDQVPQDPPDAELLKGESVKTGKAAATSPLSCDSGLFTMVTLGLQAIA